MDIDRPASAPIGGTGLPYPPRRMQISSVGEYLIFWIGADGRVSDGPEAMRHLFGKPWMEVANAFPGEHITITAKPLRKNAGMTVVLAMRDRSGEWLVSVPGDLDWIYLPEFQEAK